MLIGGYISGCVMLYVYDIYVGAHYLGYMIITLPFLGK